MRPPRSTKLGFQPPAIGEEEIAAVVETLRSGWLTSGPRAALLEERMAEYLEADRPARRRSTSRSSPSGSGRATR